jgi:RNA polymerase sigma-70 factor (ECF subfamily)
MEAAAATHGVRRKNLSLRPALGARSRKKSFDAAFESFYREHVPEVYQYALAVLGNSADAEDVTQQTFLNAYRAFQRGERPRKPHNWLIKIAHNVCRMRWRRSGRRPQEVPLESAAEPAAPDKEGESLEEVLTALARLPFNQRAAIVMREVEGRSYAEIAEVLGTTLPAVEALLFRARGNLRARRKALAATLGIAPVPASLASSLGGGSGGVIAAGGALVGSDLALKAAAVVATGVVAGGLGFKAANAVATHDPSGTRAPEPAAQLPAFAPSTLRRSIAARRRDGRGAAFTHSRSAASKQDDLRKAPTADSPSEGGPSGSANETPATSPAISTAASTATGPATDAVGGVASSVPQPPAIPTTPVTVATPVTSVTVTVPTVTLPPPPPLP